MVDSLTPRRVWFLVNLGFPGRFQYSAYRTKHYGNSSFSLIITRLKKITVPWKTSRGFFFFVGFELTTIRFLTDIQISELKGQRP